MKKPISYCCLFLVLLACSSQLYIPAESSATVSFVDLKKGRELYVNNCASCHQLYTPNKFSEKEWTENLNEMQPKAKITDEEKQLIYQYITNAPRQ